MAETLRVLKEDIICGICQDIIDGLASSLFCGHRYCYPCLNTWTNQPEDIFEGAKKCPQCRAAIGTFEMIRVVPINPRNEEGRIEEAPQMAENGGNEEGGNRVRVAVREQPRPAAAIGLPRLGPSSLGVAPAFPSYGAPRFSSTTVLPNYIRQVRFAYGMFGSSSSSRHSSASGTPRPVGANAPMYTGQENVNIIPGLGQIARRLIDDNQIVSGASNVNSAATGEDDLLSRIREIRLSDERVLEQQ